MHVCINELASEFILYLFKPCTGDTEEVKCHAYRFLNKHQHDQETVQSIAKTKNLYNTLINCSFDLPISLYNSFFYEHDSTECILSALLQTSLSTV